MQIFSPLVTVAASAKPAGGAAIGQVIIATAGALVATGILFSLIYRHRTGKGQLLQRLSAFAERVSGLPGWAALPSGIAPVSLLIALLGMYWDIALHIDDGRDAGPLANPAHYLILVGLFGIFAAGVHRRGAARRARSPTPVRRQDRGRLVRARRRVLIFAAGAFALIGFPLDDMWHRLFGQDVTLWGPTHLMLIGGAGMTLIGQAILLREGSARGRRGQNGDAALR